MKPLVIAHRGFSARAPENTLAAFRLAWESGVDGVECDVHLTADGQVVCIHDDNTERVSTQALEVASSGWAELSKLDVGSWKGEAWSGEPIPRLQNAMREGPPDLVWVIEIKCGPEMVDALLEAVDATGHDWDRVIVISFVGEALRELKAKRSGVKAYWLSYLDEQTEGSFSPSIDEIIRRVKALGVDGFGGQSGRGITPGLSRALQSAGLELNVWTVDDPVEGRRMRDIEVTSITTNDPEKILQSI